LTEILQPVTVTHRCTVTGIRDRKLRGICPSKLSAVAIFGKAPVIRFYFVTSPTFCQRRCDVGFDVWLVFAGMVPLRCGLDTKADVYGK